MDSSSEDWLNRWFDTLGDVNPPALPPPQSSPTQLSRELRPRNKVIAYSDSGTNARMHLSPQHSSERSRTQDPREPPQFWPRPTPFLSGVQEILDTDAPPVHDVAGPLSASSSLQLPRSMVLGSGNLGGRISSDNVSFALRHFPKEQHKTLSSLSDFLERSNPPCVPHAVKEILAEMLEDSAPSPSTAFLPKTPDDLVPTREKDPVSRHTAHIYIETVHEIVRAVRLYSITNVGETFWGHHVIFPLLSLVRYELGASDYEVIPAQDCSPQGPIPNSTRVDYILVKKEESYGGATKRAVDVLRGWDKTPHHLRLVPAGAIIVCAIEGKRYGDVEGALGQLERFWAQWRSHVDDFTRQCAGPQCEYPPLPALYVAQRSWDLSLVQHTVLQGDQPHMLQVYMRGLGGSNDFQEVFKTVAFIVETVRAVTPLIEKFFNDITLGVEQRAFPPSPKKSTRSKTTSTKSAPS